ncbi:MAG: heavy-metal-associated domain-containing protein [Gemmatimonadota bacterium]
METKTVKVPSISCGHCVSTIEREVGGLRGVAAVEAEQLTREVKISWDPEATDWVVIRQALEGIDHPPGD